MLAHDICVAVALADGIILRQTGTQTCSVKDSARTDDAMFGNTGDIAHDISQDINRVADDKVNGIGSIFRNIRDDALENVYIGLSKIKSRLAGLAGDTGGYNDNVGILGVDV